MESERVLQFLMMVLRRNAGSFSSLAFKPNRWWQQLGVIAAATTLQAAGATHSTGIPYKCTLSSH